MLFVWAVVDESTSASAPICAPLMVGMVVMAVGISFGANAGYAINPARDFGPRIFAWIAGWGKLAIPGNYGCVNDYFWVPIVGPLIGGALATWVYDFGIKDVLMAAPTRLRVSAKANPARTPVGPSDGRRRSNNRRRGVRRRRQARAAARGSDTLAQGEER